MFRVIIGFMFYDRKIFLFTWSLDIWWCNLMLCLKSFDDAKDLTLLYPWSKNIALFIMLSWIKTESKLHLKYIDIWSQKYEVNVSGQCRLDEEEINLQKYRKIVWSDCFLVIVHICHIRFNKLIMVQSDYPKLTVTIWLHG